MKKQETHLNMTSDAFQKFWEEADEGREYSLLVTGYSMRPSLLHGRSVVYISRISPEQKLKRGDIILFRRNGGAFVLHRIVKINPDGSLRMNGDAQNWQETVPRDQIWARVSRIRRTGRAFSADVWWYRLYAALWRRLYPIRPWILRVWKKFSGIIH